MLRKRSETVMKTMTIGRLAKEAGVNIDTIRYYERHGLLPRAARRPSGYREYASDDVERLNFIRRAKELGFSLSDIGELLSLSADRGSDMRGVKSKAQDHLIEVEQKIRQLQKVRRGLKALVAACPGHGDLASCPIVAALSTSVSRDQRR
jgi:MerR family transcriptional regulator, copper efflux regulator